MYRREFIKSSGVVIGVAVIGMPSLLEAIEPEIQESFDHSRPRLKGHKKLGCARSLNNPAIALQPLVEFPTYFT